MDLTERYELVLLINTGMGLIIGFFSLGALITCLHNRTRNIIISELSPKTENDSLKLFEDDKELGSPRMPRHGVSSDPEGQYVTMSRSRSYSNPYFNRGPMPSFRLPTVLHTTRKLTN